MGKRYFIKQLSALKRLARLASTHPPFSVGLGFVSVFRVVCSARSPFRTLCSYLAQESGFICMLVFRRSTPLGSALYMYSLMLSQSSTPSKLSNTLLYTGPCIVVQFVTMGRFWASRHLNLPTDTIPFHTAHIAHELTFRCHASICELCRCYIQEKSLRHCNFAHEDLLLRAYTARTVAQFQLLSI